MDIEKSIMYKLLHIHSNIIFIDHSRRYIDERFHNEIAFLGENNNDNVVKLNGYGISYKIYANTKIGIKTLSEYANQFDGVIFHSLTEIHVQILYSIQSKVKTFLKFFGYELYNLRMDDFLSKKTLQICAHTQENYSVLSWLKRKIKILINKDYTVKLDNQKKVYKRFDAILVVNKFEYDELQNLFYLPKLIERQLIDQTGDLSICRTVSHKSNTIIVGNNGAEINNHIDVLDIISDAVFDEEIEFKLFFNYGNQRDYSKKLKKIVQKTKNVKLIEDFLSMSEFESVYATSSALVINSYRQNALGNIFMAIEVGCKIYLNKQCSTYKWLKSKGFIISEVDELKDDLESGNFKLSIEDQQKNIDCFVRALESYPVKEFLNNIIFVLEKK